MYVFRTAADLDTAHGLRAAAFRLVAAADRTEIQVVRRSVTFAKRWRLEVPARILTRLGNGWLYPIAAALLLLTSFQSATRCVIAAAVNLALAFLIYPPLKRMLARTRPCHRGAGITAPVEPLDRYACPSGHAMTAAAFGVPMILAAPVAAPLVIGGWLLVSWSRIALGHHFVSDIVIGTLLGAAIASVVAPFIL